MSKVPLKAVSRPDTWTGARMETTGVPRSQETTPSLDPAVGLCLGSYGGPREGGLFLMREVPLARSETSE